MRSFWDISVRKYGENIFPNNLEWEVTWN